MLNVHVSLSPLYFFPQPILGVSDVEITPISCTFWRGRGRKKEVSVIGIWQFIHSLSQKNKGAAMGERERKRGMEHVYGISQRRAPEGKGEKQSVRYKKK